MVLCAASETVRAINAAATIPSALRRDGTIGRSQQRHGAGIPKVNIWQMTAWTGVPSIQPFRNARRLRLGHSVAAFHEKGRRPAPIPSLNLAWVAVGEYRWRAPC